MGGKMIACLLFEALALIVLTVGVLLGQVNGLTGLSISLGLASLGCLASMVLGREGKVG